MSPHRATGTAAEGGATYELSLDVGGGDGGVRTDDWLSLVVEALALLGGLDDEGARDGEAGGGSLGEVEDEATGVVVVREDLADGQGAELVGREGGGAGGRVALLVDVALDGLGASGAGGLGGGGSGALVCLEGALVAGGVVEEGGSGEACSEEVRGETGCGGGASRGRGGGVGAGSARGLSRGCVAGRRVRCSVRWRGETDFESRSASSGVRTTRRTEQD